MSEARLPLTVEVLEEERVQFPVAGQEECGGPSVPPPPPSISIEQHIVNGTAALISADVFN